MNRSAQHKAANNMTRLILIVAFVTMVASSPVFGLIPVGNEILAAPGPGDETYNVTGSDLFGIFGTITLDSSSGSWVLGDPNFPIVSYDISVAAGTNFVNLFNSANVTDDSIPDSPFNAIAWNATAITSIELGLVNSDPFSGDFIGGDFYLYGDTGGLGDFPGGSPIFSGPITLPAATPDACGTWLLLSGVCAILGARQVLNRQIILKPQGK